MSTDIDVDGNDERETHAETAFALLRRLPLTPAQQAIVVEALYVVKRVAKSLGLRRRRRLDDDEIASVGGMALVQAAQSFDQSGTVSFATFASYRVRGALLDAAAKEASYTQSLAAGVYADAWAYLSGQGGYSREDVMRDTDEQMQGRLRDFSDWLLASAFAGLVRRLEREGGEDAIAARQTYARAIEALREARSELNDRENKLLDLHYDQGLSMARVAEELGVQRAAATRYRARVLERLAAKLRHRGVFEADAEEP